MSSLIYYDFFSVTSTSLVIYAIICVLLLVAGFVGNFMIIYSKFKKCSKLSGLEFFIANFAFHQILNVITHTTFLSQELFPQVITYELCVLKNFLMLSNRFSSILVLTILITLAEFYSKIKFEIGLILSLLTWICSIFYAYPFYYKIDIAKIKLSNGVFIELCTAEYSNEIVETTKTFFLNNLILYEVLLYILYFIISGRRSQNSRNKDIMLYVFSIAFYVFIQKVTYYISFSFEFSILIYNFSNLMGAFESVFNVLCYAYFQRKILNEKRKRNENSIEMINFC